MPGYFKVSTRTLVKFLPAVLYFVVGDHSLAAVRCRLKLNLSIVLQMSLTAGLSRVRMAARAATRVEHRCARVPTHTRATSAKLQEVCQSRSCFHEAHIIIVGHESPIVLNTLHVVLNTRHVACHGAIRICDVSKYWRHTDVHHDVILLVFSTWYGIWSFHHH